MSGTTPTPLSTTNQYDLLKNLQGLYFNAPTFRGRVLYPIHEDLLLCQEVDEDSDNEEGPSQIYPITRMWTDGWQFYKSQAAWQASGGLISHLPHQWSNQQPQAEALSGSKMATQSAH